MVDNTPRVLAGRYEVGELIGRGGMAEVHIGHDARLGRTVAIKVLRSDLARDPSFLARFRREAQAAAALNHPAIVAVYDTGEDVHTDPATGNQVHIPFIVMEYVEGHTVRDILQDGAAVPIEEAVEITVGVLSALEYSHHAGIVHRDIKPANVMITPTGAVKVMDFGIARAVADSAATMTQTHAVIGTAQYLSPEQARGEQVDARSDLYSTGCLLFELLTGRPPFTGDSPVAVAYQHVGQAPQRPSEVASDVPEVLDRITLKALAKERTTRYSSAAEFRADLEAAVRGASVSAPALGAAGIGAAAATTVMGAADPTLAYPGAAAGDQSTQLMTPADAAPTQQWGATGLPAAVAPSPFDAAATPAGPTGPSPEEQAAARRKKAIIWTVVGLALAIVAVVVGILLSNGDETPEIKQVAVPAVQVGSTREQARQVIEAEGFVFRDALDTDSDAARDTSTRQDPEAGTLRDEGSVVTVYFSSGPGTVGVPELAGKTQEEAKAALEALGLTMGSVTPEASADVPEGRVTRSSPGVNQAVSTGSSVDVFISDGTVDLPDLTGMTQEQAEAALRERNLNTTIDRQESSQPEGTVIEQTPAAGQVAQRSNVRIVIAIPQPVQQVPVVDLSNQPWNEELAGTCAPLNCTVTGTERSATVAPGSVIRTEPPAGTMLPEGSMVGVIISEGPEATPDPSPSPEETEPPAEDEEGGE